MATISVGRIGERYSVAVDGRLGATDLKRLERACRFALEHKDVPLEIHLEHVSTLDDSARAYLDRLRARGAHIYGGADPQDQAADS